VPTRKSEKSQKQDARESAPEVKRPAVFYGLLVVFAIWIGYLIYVIAMF
jgi:hypothetical protein